jgi:ABC-type antimicrobial peptide transport system permease subunit
MAASRNGGHCSGPVPRLPSYSDSAAWPLRGTLLRQVLAESLVLSFAGALLSLAFAYWGSYALALLMTEGNVVPVSLDLSPDLRVLSLTLSVAILTGILFGLAPA